MKRNIIIKSLNKQINTISSLFFFFILAVLFYFSIEISKNLHHLKEDTTSINISIENLKNYILVIKNKNDLLIRNTIRSKAKKFGMNKISDKKRINSNLYR